ncbi:MAG: CDP-diacylglycerol--glycerol-3-phosphate 3-phosphatidyltransferase [Clostridia bacterium]|nr:CDP-diacylglycerol--glycerol-3-phosphate 3-phosphatidyltransferase [Clostridia bacterium]
MNLPNKLTVARMILVFAFAVFAFPLNLFTGAAWVALCIYILASATDALDGHIARKNNQVTDFGKFLDPLADKLLVNTALISLIPFMYVYYGELAQIVLWATLINLAREFAVSGIRMLAASGGKVIAAGKLGKFKMIAQTLALVVLLLGRATHEGTVSKVCVIAGLALLGIATVLAVWSGIEYIAGNKNLLKNMK